jgi:ribosomal protein L3 glutamine methyltransferase
MGTFRTGSDEQSLYFSAPKTDRAYVTSELASIIDFIRYGASRFSAAGLTFGHSHDNPIDEATHLVLASLHLPPDIPPAYGAGKLTAEERARVLALIERRITERLPVAYLVGETWFAGLKFKSDRRALVPRSPIAELIESGFTPWMDGRHVEHALDLCTGSGCIGIAMAEYNPHWQVDIVDISEDALSLARENVAFQHVGDRVEVVKSDLFGGLKGRKYDLVVSNLM